MQLVERAGARHPLNPTVIPEGVGAAAGAQQGARRAGKSIRIPEEALVAVKPDVVVICPCGLGLAKAREAARELTRKAWWGDLPAVRKGRVAVVDGNHYFNRPGPRLADAFEWLVGYVQGREQLMGALEGFWEPLAG